MFGLVFFIAALTCGVMGSDTKCWARRGDCQDETTPCAGYYRSGLCSGPNSRKCCVPPSEFDNNCKNQSGTCQDVSNTCNGYYKSGLCAGPVSRRCCIPSLGEERCGDFERKMACWILKSRFLQAARTHESGNVDRATAYNNLYDMCEGKKAARSSYACDECPSGPPGGFVCLSATLLKYLVNIQSMGAVTINELAGGCHSCESRHYSGLAVTLKSDRRSPDYIRVCEGMRGYAQDKGEHVQCQFYDGPHPNGFEF